LSAFALVDRMGLNLQMVIKWPLDKKGGDVVDRSPDGSGKPWILGRYDREGGQPSSYIVLAG
jgi:hypothetical protein